MDILGTLTQAAPVAALIGLVVFIRALAPRPGDAGSLFTSASDLGWPRGIQEEEPVRFQLDRPAGRRATPPVRETGISHRTRQPRDLDRATSRVG